MKKVLMKFLASLMLCVSIFSAHASGLTGTYKTIFDQLVPEFPGYSSSSKVIYSLGAIEGWNNPTEKYGVTVFYNPFIEGIVNAQHRPHGDGYYDTTGIDGTAVAIAVFDEHISFDKVSALARSEYFGPTTPAPTVYFLTAIAPTPTVPEPSTLGMVLAGVCAFLLMRTSKISNQWKLRRNTHDKLVRI